MYAVFRVTEFLPPRRSVLAYGVNSTDAQVSYIAANCNASVIEECASIRVASASLALRNEVTRDITRMIETATRRQAPGDLIKALTDLRDIDPPKADDLIEVRKLALALMMQYGIDRARSWSDDAAVSARLGKKLAKYQTEREKTQK